MPRQCLMAAFLIRWPWLEQLDSPYFLRREGLHWAVSLGLLAIGAFSFQHKCDENTRTSAATQCGFCAASVRLPVSCAYQCNYDVRT